MATIEGMARKKPKAGRAPHYTLNTRLSTKIGEAMEAFIAAQEIRPDKRDLVEVALRRFLAARGFDPDRPESWPRQADA